MKRRQRPRWTRRGTPALQRQLGLLRLLLVGTSAAYLAHLYGRGLTGRRQAQRDLAHLKRAGVPIKRAGFGVYWIPATDSVAWLKGWAK